MAAHACKLMCFPSRFTRFMSTGNLTTMAKDKSADDNLFKVSFKYYKRRRPPPDFSGLVDFDKPLPSPGVFSPCPLPASPNEELVKPYNFEELGLNSLNTWRAFQLSSTDGFYIIRNPFTPLGQRMWVKRCIETYPQKPNLTNVDEQLTTNDTIWEIHKNTKKSDRADGILSKLRWVTLGYQYEWKTKLYDLTHFPKFPDEMENLTKCIAAVLGFENYMPEAALVNFYAMDSQLGGHTDHSELDHTSPLISISLGQSAVFLLGGKTKDVKPFALRIDSGDIVVMHGPCRLIYHGIPRILPAVIRPWDCNSCAKQEHDDWELFANYINNFRININVRQVFPR